MENTVYHNLWDTTKASLKKIKHLHKKMKE